MKKEGLARTIKSLVCFDDFKPTEREECLAVGIRLYTYQEVIEAGAGAQEISFKRCTPNDCPIFSYTSGTTGDSKGVKLTHRNLHSSVESVIELIRMTEEDSLISYLPYPHSFEQVMLHYGNMVGCKTGFYQGDPLKLTEDLAVLKPALFPSVPRLWNRIYTKIKGTIDGLTGCKGWLA